MTNTACVIHPQFAPGRRILAVSDIHGNLPFFQGLLQKIRFASEDILILDGDMLEKGPDSLALLRYVMELSRTHTVYPICGNCDGLVYRFFETDELDQRFYASYLPQHPESTIRQLAEEMGYEDWQDFPGLRLALRDRYPEIRAWLASLPTILETEHLVFVHGGVPSLEHMETLDRWKCMKNDDFRGQGHSFSKYVIVGHWPVTLYNPKIPSAAPLFDYDRKIISIDGGCVLKADGQLNALILPSEESEAFTWTPSTSAGGDPTWSCWRRGKSCPCAAIWRADGSCISSPPTCGAAGTGCGVRTPPTTASLWSRETGSTWWFEPAGAVS